MFGWFRPTCPCDAAAKQWVEEQLRWLTKQFGLHILLERPIILPTPEFFPDAYDGSPKAVRKLFRRVCGFMGVNGDEVEIRLFNDKQEESLRKVDPSRGIAAGLWSSEGIIRLEKSGLDRPSDLIGTMAHELSHQLLLGQNRIEPDRYDNELLTDLTAVFHGFGVFLANSPHKSTGDLSRWPGTVLHRPEYLSEPMFGYAMAHIAWFRDEPRPPWTGHLRWAIRGTFKQGLRYLHETADSTFKPIRLHREPD